MNDTEKLEKIARIVSIHEDNANDEEGDKYLSDAVLTMEAISDVLSDIKSGALRTFEEVGA